MLTQVEPNLIMPAQSEISDPLRLVGESKGTSLTLSFSTLAQ
jgi:hypothetical protein